LESGGRYNTVMLTGFPRWFPSVLLAGLVAGSVISSFAQTSPATQKPTKKRTAVANTKAVPGSGKKTSAATVSVSTPKQKLSYALGADMGRRLKAASVDVDAAVVARGMSDALTGSKTLLTDDEMRATMAEFQKQLGEKQAAVVKELSDKNKKEGDAFLAENKTKEGVVALPSGLQYKVLKMGEGAKPTAADTVVCNYRGTLLNGKEFDSSYKRNEPATFPVGRVIKGWTEALQLMPTGSKWQLFIPPDLAYGDRGAGADIEPNSTLIFEVELLSIQSKDQGKDKQNPPGK
jgi:FKBP-type peptidyl-prolyl cis-trans isomerase FklB